MTRREFEFPERTTPAVPLTRSQRRASVVNSLTVFLIGVALVVIGVQADVVALPAIGLVLVVAALAVGATLLVRRQTVGE